MRENKKRRYRTLNVGHDLTIHEGKIRFLIYVKGGLRFNNPYLRDLNDLLELKKKDLKALIYEFGQDM